MCVCRFFNKDSRANAGQVGRQDADKRHKCSVFDILNVKSRASVAAMVKQWPKFARAQKVWKRAVSILFSNEAGSGGREEEGGAP